MSTGLAIEDGRVIALDVTGANLQGNQAIDLAGRTVLPGFIDAHLHFGAYALAVQEVDLDACASLGAGPDILRRAAERLPPNAWLRGRGWDRNRWACLPTSADLDVRGSLTVAKDADLVVLSGDPFEAESWAAR